MIIESFSCKIEIGRTVYQAARRSLEPHERLTAPNATDVFCMHILPAATAALTFSDESGISFVVERWESDTISKGYWLAFAYHAVEIV
jgi:hypothetical protein